MTLIQVVWKSYGGRHGKAWQIQQSLDDCLVVKALGRNSNHAKELNWLATAVDNYIKEGISSSANEESQLVVRSSQVEHQSTAMESAADVEDLNIIRELFGSRAQVLINTLPAFDAYFKWYYGLLRQSVHIDSPLSVRENRAFENFCAAAASHEMAERLTAHMRVEETPVVSLPQGHLHGQYGHPESR